MADDTDACAEGSHLETVFNDCCDPVWKPARLYEPLDTARKEIRLLQIRPTKSATQDDPIECIMMSTTLTEQMYDAVSYVWGSTANLQSILVNGHIIQVTRNLFALLTEFRANTRFNHQLLWIDAICIDQANVDERSTQVQMMGDIYAGAAVVHVWLGYATDQTGRLFQHLTGFGSRMNPGLVEQMKAIAQDAQLWPEWRRLASSKWFTRLWVIQEASLAKMPILWCGSFSMPLDGFRNFARCHVTYQIFNGELLKGNSSSIELMRKNTRIAQVGSVTLTTKPGSREIFSIFYHGRDADCSDPRDHVYALLSLLPPDLCVAVDYRLSVVQVYASMTLRLMDWSKNLEALCLAQSRNDTDMPSWVLDFRDLARDYGQRTSDADAGASWSSTSRHPKELQVRGIAVSSVVFCQHWHGLMKSAEFLALFDPNWDKDEALRQGLKVWRQTARRHVESSSPGPKFSDEAFWSAIMPETVIGMSPGDRRIEDIKAENIRHADDDAPGALSEWVDADEGSVKAMVNFYSIPTVYNNVQSLLFLTSDGRFGGVDGQCRVGDTVAILAGLSQPVILRRQADWTPERPSWLFISTCRCSGLMDGDYIRNLAKIKTGDSTRVDEVFEDMILT